MYICCNKSLKVVQNGVLAEVKIAGESYQLYHSDRWQCPACGRELIVTAGEPIAEVWQPTYLKVRKSVKEIDIYSVEF